MPRSGDLGQVGVNDSCILTVPVHGLEEQPFAEWVLRQPIKLHGAWLRSHKDICFPAYLQALEQAAPFMAKFPVLEEVVGGVSAWEDKALAASHWSGLLSSGHQDGAELREAWAFLQQEAQDAAAYLGETVEGVLAEAVEGAGHSTTGVTRTKIVEQREATRARLLLRVLELHPDREASTPCL